MKKHEQKALAAAVCVAAADHGATCEVTYDATWHEYHVALHFPDVSASLTLDRMTGNPQSSRGDVLVSWYSAKRDLNPHAFQSINTCHWRKASDVAPADSVAALIRRRAAAIQRGNAFKPEA